MHLAQQTLHDLFFMPKQYSVPLFQRDYQWGRDQQWEPLFRDLEKVALAVREDATPGKSNVKPHFMGAIVLKQKVSSGLPDDEVIDGQQRLTTLQLLVRGMVDAYQAKGVSPVLVSKLRGLIENGPEYREDNEEWRFKVWPRLIKTGAWRQAMSDQPTPGAESNYLQARRYFAEQTMNALAADAASPEHLAHAVQRCVQFVVIKLDDRDDAQVIFEALNARQARLTVTDLFKNFIFLRASKRGEKVAELYNRHWRRFDGEAGKSRNWWEENLGVGHAARERRDVFLSAWLTAKKSAEVSVDQLYMEARAFLEQSTASTEQLLMDLGRFADAFETIYRRPPGLALPVARAYERVERLQMTTALPLLTWLQAAVVDSIITPEEHARAVRAIDSWIVRQLVTDRNTRSYAKLFVELLQSAQEAVAAKGSPADAIEQSLLTTTNKEWVWPTDDQVRAAMLHNRFYGKVSPQRIRLLLGAIDEQMRVDNPRSEPGYHDYWKLQVEHLLPDTWDNEGWPLEAKDPLERRTKADERELAKNRIGNLTLVAGRLNGHMSNRSWDHKRAALLENSNLRLNVAIAKAQSWDEQAIQERGRHLAEYVCRIWTRPAGGREWSDADLEQVDEGSRLQERDLAEQRRQTRSRFWDQLADHLRVVNPDLPRLTPSQYIRRRFATAAPRMAVDLEVDIARSLARIEVIFRGEDAFKAWTSAVQGLEQLAAETGEKPVVLEGGEGLSPRLQWERDFDEFDWGSAFAWFAATLGGLWTSSFPRFRRDAGLAAPWTWERFEAVLREKTDEQCVQAALRIKEWFDSQAAGVEVMNRKTGSVVPLFDAPFYPLRLTGTGRVVVQFARQKAGPFADQEFKQQFLAKLRSALDVDWDDDAIEGKPAFPLKLLVDDARWAAFQSILGWLKTEAADVEEEGNE